MPVFSFRNKTGISGVMMVLTMILLMCVALVTVEVVFSAAHQLFGKKIHQEVIPALKHL
jgi:hypothetical protein